MLTFLFSNWKLFGIGILSLFLIFVIWQINNAFNQAARVPALLSEIKILKQDIEAERKGCILSKQPAKVANDYDKKNSDDLLTTCLNSLRDTPVCLPAGGTASCANPARGQQADKLEHKKDRNDLNAAKIWAQECIKAKLCN